MRMLGEGRTTEEEQLLLKMEKMEKEGKKKDAEKSPLLKSRHPQLPVFTSSVKLQSQPGRGRFLVAAKDISPGECIAEETSFASVLDAQFCSTHCNLCAAPAPQTVPCPTCAAARSPPCRGLSKI